MKLCVIIPTYNEEKNLGPLLKDLKLENYEVAVIDDGSTDQTGAIAKAAGVFIISHSVRQGKGMSLRDGFNFAIKNNYDWVITMDGDGQHSVEDIANFIICASGHKADMIVGNRMADVKGMPFVRILTNKFMSKIISLLCHQDIPDSQCGFRFISSEVLRNISLDCDRFEIESEVLLAASKKGYKIISTPIQTIYRGEKSRINPFLDTLRFFRFIFKHLWTSKA